MHLYASIVDPCAAMLPTLPSPSKVRVRLSGWLCVMSHDRGVIKEEPTYRMKGGMMFHSGTWKMERYHMMIVL
jgi:hypothetical protein